MITKEIVDKYIDKCSSYIDSTPIDFTGITKIIFGIKDLDRKDRSALLKTINQLIIDCSEGDLDRILSESHLLPDIFEKCRFTGNITITKPVIETLSFSNAIFDRCKLILNCSQIGNNAFDCVYLDNSEVIINEGCKTIGFDVFTNMTITNSKIILPRSLQAIDTHTWDNNSYNLEVYYNGTKAEWEKNVKLKHRNECPFDTIICKDGLLEVRNV